jgi:hypothetical protein
MKCTVQVRIRRLTGGWKVADPEDRSNYVHVLPVKLSIVEDPKGYHLVMSPEGCFTADAFYETLQKAKDDAARCFGVRDADWMVKGT